MDEQVNAGMIRKVVKDDVQFDNQYLTVDEEQVKADIKEQEARALEEAKNFKPILPKLKRTEDGLIQAGDGKEISSIFDILEPGDNINHQQVIRVEDGKVELEYFGVKSELTNENEIFSVLIHEELANWKETLKKADLYNMFTDTNIEMLTLFRSLELLCMNINMNKVTHLTTSDNALDQRIIAMIIGTLRKPLYTEECTDKENCKVIAIAKDYKDIKDFDSDIILYRVALTNTTNLPIKEGDRVILC